MAFAEVFVMLSRCQSMRIEDWRVEIIWGLILVGKRQAVRDGGLAARREPSGSGVEKVRIRGLHEDCF